MPTCVAARALSRPPLHRKTPLGTGLDHAPGAQRAVGSSGARDRTVLAHTEPLAAAHAGTVHAARHRARGPQVGLAGKTRPQTSALPPLETAGTFERRSSRRNAIVASSLRSPSVEPAARRNRTQSVRRTLGSRHEDRAAIVRVRPPATATAATRNIPRPAVAAAAGRYVVRPTGPAVASGHIPRPAIPTITGGNVVCPAVATVASGSIPRSVSVIAGRPILGPVAAMVIRGNVVRPSASVVACVSATGSAVSAIAGRHVLRPTVATLAPGNAVRPSPRQADARHGEQCKNDRDLRSSAHATLPGVQRHRVLERATNVPAGPPWNSA